MELRYNTAIFTQIPSTGDSIIFRKNFIHCTDDTYDKYYIIYKEFGFFRTDVLQYDNPRWRIFDFPRMPSTIWWQLMYCDHPSCDVDIRRGMHLSAMLCIHSPHYVDVWADRTQVGPILAPWTLLSGLWFAYKSPKKIQLVSPTETYILWYFDDKPEGLLNKRSQCC